MSIIIYFSVFDLHQEYPIREASKSVYLAVAIGKARTGGPLAHHCCAKANNQRQAIEEHMNTVAKQSERACRNAIEQLYKHECKVKAATVSTFVLRNESVSIIPHEVEDATRLDSRSKLGGSQRCCAC